MTAPPARDRPPQGNVMNFWRAYFADPKAWVPGALAAAALVLALIVLGLAVS